MRFCLDCGNRLTAPEPPAQAAVPPQGVAPPQPVEPLRPQAQPGGPAAVPRPALAGAPPAPAPQPPPPDGQQACANCGTHNPSASRFCSACGSRLGAQPPGQKADEASTPATTVCARCRGANSAGMRFCQFCGAALAESSHAIAGPTPGVPRASLVVIGQDGTPGRSYAVADGQCDIGRTEGSLQLANDPYVSPRHARLIYRSGHFFVQDLDSLNGIFVRLKGPVPLENADLVLVGLEVLRFEVVSEAEQRLGPAADRGTQLFGSPAAPRHARLCQRTVEGVTRDIFFLSRTETVIGREAGDIVFTSDPFMSRRHAAITRDPRTNTFTLRDLGSSNGTYVGIRGEQLVSHGDHVRIGQHLFRLEVEGGTEQR